MCILNEADEFQGEKFFRKFVDWLMDDIVYQGNFFLQMICICSNISAIFSTQIQLHHLQNSHPGHFSFAGTYCSLVVKENVEYLRGGGIELLGEAERREQKLLRPPRRSHWYLSPPQPNGLTPDKGMVMQFLGMEQVRHRAATDPET